MKETVIDGLKYVAEPETHRCDGCAGDRDIDLCLALPDDCSEERIIWVRKD
ncbi:hypothetical protein J4G52_38140 [Burkholderia cenocepacia]|uniref:hypothetical protein n=1 Tax=Burkholderia cenocepacia TaxID=95486 RepID=UPI001AA0CE1B|nr:hypothetical protein [Burkholderia cenocepacia]MBO1859379.1 hypothetical protein [Burkholderia cenocepacia]MDR5647620.1 hypothetical protein [Burkholderia cenocepacia]